MLRIFSVIIVLFMISSLLHAENHRFETTKEGIIDALIRPDSKPRMRTRSLTRSFTLRTRSIKVIVKDRGKTDHQDKQIP